MNIVKKVPAYQTTDGEVFLDKEAAEGHQHLILFAQRIKTLVDRPVNDLVDDDKETIMGFILSNRENLKPIFDLLPKL